MSIPLCPQNILRISGNGNILKQVTIYNLLFLRFEFDLPLTVYFAGASNWRLQDTCSFRNVHFNAVSNFRILYF